MIDQKKIVNLTCFSLFLDPVEKKKLMFNPWAKRLNTPGESTLSPGETTLGKQDIRRNDLLPLRIFYGVHYVTDQFSSVLFLAHNSSTFITRVLSVL